MTKETHMRSRWIVSLLVVLVGGVTATAALATTDTSSAMPGRNGRVVFVAGSEDGNLTLVNKDGSGLVTLSKSGSDSEPAFSPDGRRIAFSSYRRGDRDIYTLAPDGSGLRQITFSRGEDRDPTWSPEGATIAFETNRNGGQIDIYSVAADGTGSPVRITNNLVDDSEAVYSPDGSKMALFHAGGVVIMNPDGSNIRPTKLRGGFSPRWSPDGSKIAFFTYNDVERYILADR